VALDEAAIKKRAVFVAKIGKNQRSGTRPECCF